MKITRCASMLLLALCAAPAWADELNIGLTISSYPQSRYNRYRPHPPIQRQPPVQIAPTLPSINPQPAVPSPQQGHDERATPPAQGNAPVQVMPQREQAREQGAATTSPGTARREQGMRGNQGEDRRQEREDREEMPYQQRD